MKLIRSALRVAAPVALLAGAACGPAAAPAGAGAGPAASVAITPELIAEGRQVFATSGRCAVCHGQTAAGGRLGPNLTDDIWLWVDTTGDMHAQIASIVRVGIPQPREAEVGMPPMGGGQLTEGEINAVAAYVGSL